MRIVVDHRALLIAVCLFSAKAQAQSRLDRVYLSTTVAGKATVDQTGERSSYVSTELALATPPARFGERVMLFGTMSGKRTWIGSGDFRDNGQLVTNDVNLGAILVARLSDRTSLTVGPAIGIRSTFETDFGWKDLMYSGIALVTWLPDEQRRWRLSVGVVTTNTVNLFPVLPIGGFEYRGERWRVEGMYPQPGVFYGVHPRVELGIGMKLDYPSYRIKETPVDGRTADYVRVTNHFGHFTVGANIFSDLWLTAKAGVMFGRVTRLMDSDREGIDASRLDIGVAPYGALVLSYRRPTPVTATPGR